tara:strand:+ start:228 stop:503 length:276 start_codon:yes stop_codon:yes gene_type:complete
MGVVVVVEVKTPLAHTLQPQGEEVTAVDPALQLLSQAVAAVRKDVPDDHAPQNDQDGRMRAISWMMMMIQLHRHHQLLVPLPLQSLLHLQW